MPTLTIDNREIEVPAGTKVIEAAERLGIMIPRFCFHPALGSVGACRVCAVSFIEGPIKGIQMSCMINAQDGMVVSTTDAEAVDFRKHVIELLMLHHPHDCPVCDEGGHCLLQDLTVSGGHGLRRYRGLKRTHHNQDLGPLVQHEMNRCIQCYRCSRYYQEYAGYRDLGVMGIGSRVYFGRSTPGVLESPFAGNLIDICPTGVYTDKPSRFLGRRWDYQRQSSLCLHCSLGCNLVVSARYRQVVRHEARHNSEVNGYFICDRGRYGYAYASASDRPRQPSVSGTPGEMAQVLINARDQIRSTVEKFGPEGVAMAASSRSSLETLAVVKQACRQHGWAGPAVVSTDRQCLNLKTAVSCLKPELAVSLGAVSAADTVVVVGADPVNEAPMLALSLRQVQRQGGQVTVIDPRHVQMPFEFDHWAVHPSILGEAVVALTQRIDTGTGTSAEPAAASLGIETFPVQALAKRMSHSRRVVIVCGTDIVTPREIALAADLAEALRRVHTEAKLFYILAGANDYAAALASEAIISMEQIIDRLESGSVRTLVVVEADLWRDFPDRERLRLALNKLDHLIVLDHVASPLNDEADYFIPTQTVYESGGHWINQEGRLQTARAVMAGGESIAITGNMDHPPWVFDKRIPGSDPPAAWRAMAELSRENSDTNANGLEQQLELAMTAFHPAMGSLPAGAVDKRIDLAAIVDGHFLSDSLHSPMEDAKPSDTLTLLLVDWTFGSEPLSTMAPALNAVEALPVARMHPREIERLGLTDEQTITVSTKKGSLSVLLQADACMAPGVLVIPRHHRLNWQCLGGTRLVLDAGAIRSSG